MRTKLTLLIASALSAIALSPSLVNAVAPLIITDVGGAVRIQQGVPCGDLVDVTTTIEEGRIEMTPFISRQLGDVLFDLTRLDIFLAPFAVHRECRGIKATAEFSRIGIQLAGAVRFPGEATGGLESGQYRFRIPKEQFLIYEVIVDNAPFPQPETSYQRPSEDVTGLIDLGRKSMQLHVVLTTEQHFVAGCMRGRCLIDENHQGTVSADVIGVTIHDTTAPTVTCTALNSSGKNFRVSADDDSGAPIIRLGEFVLTNGEVIQLQQTGQPGVRLLETGRDAVPHFQVGRGEAFITATDPSGNLATANCR